MSNIIFVVEHWASDGWWGGSWSPHRAFYDKGAAEKWIKTLNKYYDYKVTELEIV